MVDGAGDGPFKESIGNHDFHIRQFIGEYSVKSSYFCKIDGNKGW